MSAWAVVGLMTLFGAGVVIFALARASARREIAWEAVRRKTWLLPDLVPGGYE